MEKYIGLDVHATSCTAGVIDDRGKRLGRTWWRPTARRWSSSSRRSRGNGMSAWRRGRRARGCRDPVAARGGSSCAVVTDSRGQKNDKRDAFGLAEQLRTGAIERKVFKEVGASRRCASSPGRTDDRAGLGARSEPYQGAVPFARRGVSGKASTRRRAATSTWCNCPSVARSRD